MADQTWREEWDAQADEWIELTGSDPFYDDFNKPAFLELVPAPGALTLDVGCGEGRLGRELVERGHRVLGVDGSPALAGAVSRATPPLPVAVGDTTALPVASGVADMGEYRRPMRHVLDMERPNGDRFCFRVEHRPMEDYSRAFEAAGLAITALREPRPTDAQVREHAEFADFQRVPDFLHLRAERVGRS